MTTAVPAFATRIVVGFGASITGGVLIGAAAWVADQLGYPWTALIPANAIGAWIGAAFALGASARTVPTGALRGLIGLLCAVAAYYVLTGTFGEGFRSIGASHAATVWGAVALIAGPIAGAAGGAWRHTTGWPRAIAVALLSAALIAEAVVFGAGRINSVDRLVHDVGALVLVVEAAIGLALPWLLLRPSERLRGYAATAAVTAAGLVALGPVVTFVRGLADRF
jgi:hypothetical protein